jgi:chromosomal replication initiator protein
MENKDLWKAVLSELQLSLSASIFNTWIRGLVLISFNNGVAEVGCPSSYNKDMVEQRYYVLIKAILDRIVKRQTSLTFSVFTQRQRDERESETLGPLFSSLNAKQTHDQVVRAARLRADFTFELFAVSSTNEMAYAATTAVAKSPGTSYNPLFLYGGVGVGKTHLMQAVGNHVLQEKPERRVLYCTGEEFTNEIIEAIRSKSTKKVNDKYRTTDIFLIDDIQFIAGKNAIQEAFFHTFNAIYRAGGQIVLTSDRPPADIPNLENRLRSRFEGGLLIDIGDPDFELRTAILLIKAKQFEISLPMDIAQLIAANTSSTRRLEGVLRRVLSEVEIRRATITSEMIERILGKRAGTVPGVVQKKLLNPDLVIDLVASYFNLKPTALRGLKRDRPIARPRQVLMYLLRTELQIPLMEIGNLIGGRDHTTVMHGVEKITTLLSTNESLRGDIENLRKRIYG